MYSASAMEAEDFGKSWLGLGIGGGGGGDLKRSHGEPRSSSVVQFDLLFPQSVKEEAAAVGTEAEKGARKRLKITTDDGRRSHETSPSDDGGDGAGTRKKLRLTKEQSTLLEDTFRAHNILSHAQKHELARQVNLSARQVEVWFQNRRARTKLKQTEVDCEILKRCCESLTGENQRLKHELAQLQRSAAAAGIFVQFPRSATAMATICPSCEKVTTATSGGDTSKSSSYSS
ncbi:Homeobox-leucine zipper protein HOX18 [Dichanthelium oligosanthes]|uniref:Homeobox-leucine zipper protein HOX18 n=1 Tax=Dichanthelium oligosanthes TaxID=888268 RepID=A0A1E5VJN7_9POAL|nr:Homeobox-leucine zipper protein HOX18 [Dichanthelium oligosanthes]